jgi:hypothetical protein
VGSLYLISYPVNNSVNISLIDSGNIEKSNIKNFAYYESQLISGGQLLDGNLQSVSESGTALNQTDLVASNLAGLMAENTSKLQSSMKVLELNSIELTKFRNAPTDLSDFEKSICPQQKSDIPPPECVIKSKNSNPKKVLIIGDSKMGMLTEGIAQYFKVKDWQIDYDVMLGCSMSQRLSSFDARTCNTRIDWTLKQIVKVKYDLIVFSEYPRVALSKSIQDEFYKNLISNGKMVLFLGQYGHIDNPQDCITKNNIIPLSCTMRPTQDLKDSESAKTTQILLQSQNVKFIDTSKWFCLPSNCPISINGIFAFRDGVHITNTYAKTFTPIINSMLDDILKY